MQATSSIHDSNPSIQANMTRLWGAYMKLLEMLSQEPSVSEARVFSPMTKDLSRLWMEGMQKIMDDPEPFYQHHMNLLTGYTQIWSDAFDRWIEEANNDSNGNVNEEDNPKESPSTGKGFSQTDRRFKDPLWEENLFFKALKDSYLYVGDYLLENATSMGIEDPALLRKYEFYTRQCIDALSPSNYAMTNPQVIRSTLETQGENLIQGMENLIEDLKKSDSLFQISTTDPDQFTLGKDIATTPGKVVYRNEMMELIQYSPITAKTHKIPLLIIPAWINKYYILDLSEHNSMVRWLLEQGYTVFMISWVNPTKEYKDVPFDHYITHGALQALDVVMQIADVSSVNTVGYCLGGTMLACLVAYLEAKGQGSKIASTTFLTTMVDFSDVGDMSVFISEEQIQVIEEQMEKDGYLDGAHMNAIFNILRSNDLIWSFVINNYLLGKGPLPFDILYWNSDATRLPAKAHATYLRQMYLYNNLIKAGKISIDGEKIDLSSIQTDSYLLAAKEDHIAPWVAAYKTLPFLQGNARFVLTASGHVAGVINHPKKDKYEYWTSSDTSKALEKTPKNVLAQSYPKDPEQWLNKATAHAGSWWKDWSAWLQKRSGQKVVPPSLGSDQYTTLGDAPGEYVTVK